MTHPPAVIVWFRDDLRLSDHPALHEAAKSGAPVIGLYVLDEQSRSEARGPPPRRGCALVACAVAAAVAGKPEQRRHAGAAPRPRRAGGHGARARDRGATVFWNEIAQEAELAVPTRSKRRSRRSPSRRRFPGDLLVAPGDPQQGGPRPARLHAVLAARAVAGRSAEAAAGAERGEKSPRGTVSS